MWPKKNGVGKEQAAKLVDDIFRFVFSIPYLSCFYWQTFYFLINKINAVSVDQTNDGVLLFVLHNDLSTQ